MAPPVPPEEVARLVGMSHAGLSIHQISAQTGYCRSTVSRLLKRHNDTGSYSRRPGSGSTRVTTAREDRHLVNSAQRSHTVTATRLRQEHLNASGRLISTQTVRNRLHEAGLYARRQCRQVFLLPRHRRARLEWATEHLNWGSNEWRRVLFSDESRFTIDGPDRRIKIWRRTGERYFNSNFQEVDTFHQKSLMIWAGIGYNMKSVFHTIEGNLTALKYRDEILDIHVRPFNEARNGDFVFMDDNARPHRGHVVTNYLRDHEIEHLEWPAKSPDLNPIEHLWDQLGRALNDSPRRPCTLEDLKNSLQQEWEQIPMENVIQLVESMPRRCMAVVEARGGHTRY